MRFDFMFSNLSGQTLGKYELRDLLGAGGMGAVYRAYDHALRREVAVKVINLTAGGADLQARFIREAQTSAALEHNHIVRIYDYGVEGDVNYVVMQYLTGGSLAERIKQAAEQGRPRASLTEVAALLQHLASALDYAHGRGVVHRDIKPANVMFDNQGQAFIVDFGIAKLLTGATNLTGTNMAMGTPSYMPPEQWSQRDLTPAADQYALAVTTYQLVSGRLPFEADSVPSLWYKIENDQPTPLHILRPDIPHDAMMVINRAMAKIPGARFPNCTQFAQAFEAATYGSDSGATEYFTFKLARPAASAVSRTPTPQTPSRMSGSGTPPPGGSTPSIAVTPPAPQARGGLPRGLLIGGALAIVALIVAVVLALSGRGPSESDLRLTEVNNTLVAAGLATASEATRQSGLELIATETATPTATDSPTDSPSSEPTTAPTDAPSATPTDTATDSPTITPTATPTDAPTATPTDTPTATATVSAREAALATLDTAATLTATQWTPTWTPDFDATVRAEITAVFIETQSAIALTQAALTLAAVQTRDANATISAGETLAAQQAQDAAATEIAAVTQAAQQALDATATVNAERTAASQQEFDAQATEIAAVTLVAQQTADAAATLSAEQTQAAQAEIDARATGIAEATLFAQQTQDALPTAAPTIGPEGGIYTVQAGDTLPLIAVRFHISIIRLADANGISVATVVSPGQQLHIPPVATAAPTRTPTIPPELRPTFTPTVTPPPRDKIRLENANRLAEITQIQPPSSAALYSARFSPDGTRIVYGTSANQVVIYDLAAQRNIRTLSGHDTTVVSTVWSPDGTRVASGDGHGKVYVWDATTGERVLELAGHTSTVFGLAYSPDGGFIVSGSNDASVRVWDARTGQQVVELTGNAGTTYKTAFTNDGSRVASVSSDARVRVWDWRNARLISETQMNGFVGALAFNPDGDTFATGTGGTQSGEVHLWSLSTYAPFRILQIPDYVLDVAFNREGSLLAVVGWDDTLHVFDWRNGVELATLAGHSADIQAVDFSPDGTLIVTSAEDGTLRLWGIP